MQEKPNVLAKTAKLRKIRRELKKDLPPQPTPSSHEKILGWIDENFDFIVYPDGFEDCIVGVGERYGGPPVAVLDIEKMLTKLEKEGLTREQALEHFESNVLDVSIGAQSPVYLHIPNFNLTKKTSSRKGKATK